MSDSEESVPGEPCPTASHTFSEQQRSYLEKFYNGGMTGWGRDHAAEIELALAATGLSLSQIKNWIRRRNRRQKAGEKGKLMVVPTKSLTKWQKYVKNFAASKEGVFSKAQGASHFNKEASKSYQLLSDVERGQLVEDESSETVMTSAQINRRARKIIQHIQDEFSELESLGYKGFAVAFCGSKSQVVGTQSVLSSLSPKIMEYFYGIIAYGSIPLIETSSSPSSEHPTTSASLPSSIPSSKCPTTTLIPSSKRPTTTSIPTSIPSSIPSSKCPTTTLIPSSKRPTTTSIPTSIPSSIPSSKCPTTTSIPSSKRPTTTSIPTSIPSSKCPTTTSIPSSEHPTTSASIPSSIPSSKRPTTTSIPSSKRPTTTSIPSSIPSSKRPDINTSHGNPITSLPTTSHPSITNTTVSHSSNDPSVGQYPEIWISRLALYCTDQFEILNNKWLSDSVINAAQTLLKQFSLQGLQSPQCGRNLTFKVLPLNNKYVQILHVDGNHWIVVSNCMANHPPEKERVLIYDSLLPNKVSYHTKEMICSFVRPLANSYTFDIINIARQTNSYDCGVIAIANATEIAYGCNPVRCIWNTSQLRHHLVKCLEEGKMSRFPTLRERRLGFGRAIKAHEVEAIHCICRMPDNKEETMIQCSTCRMWCHSSCMNIEDVAEYTGKKWSCVKCEEQ